MYTYIYIYVYGSYAYSTDQTRAWQAYVLKAAFKFKWFVDFEDVQYHWDAQTICDAVQNWPITVHLHGSLFDTFFPNIYIYGGTSSVK